MAKPNGSGVGKYNYVQEVIENHNTIYHNSPTSRQFLTYVNRQWLLFALCVQRSNIFGVKLNGGMSIITVVFSVVGDKGKEVMSIEKHIQICLCWILIIFASGGQYHKYFEGADNQNIIFTELGTYYFSFPFLALFLNLSISFQPARLQVIVIC